MSGLEDAQRSDGRLSGHSPLKSRANSKLFRRGHDFALAPSGRPFGDGQTRALGGTVPTADVTLVLLPLGRHSIYTVHNTEIYSPLACAWVLQ